MPRFIVLASLVALVFTTHAGAQSPGPSQAAQNDTALQGRWVVTAAEHQGKPFDAIKGGVMTVAGDGFEVRTASGNMLTGTLRVDASKTPSQLDMMHADGTRWEAIYAVEGDTFRMNYVEADGKETRPATFTTNDATEATIIVLRRQSK